GRFALFVFAVMTSGGAAIAKEPATQPTTVPAARLVTLHMLNAKPQQVAAALAKQAGVEVRLTETNHPPISVDIERQPFWLALRQICGQLGVAPTTSTITDLILLEPTEDWFKRPAHASGPALFTADQLHHTRTIHASGANRSDVFDFNFSACVDPS